MHSVGFLLLLAILFALIFDFVNGFHDTANAIATVVSTRVLTPRAAILMAAVLNFVGALISTHVAKTITSGLVDPKDANQVMILSAILGAIAWNLITWRFGIPSSSSHALIGGIVGAGVARGGLAIVQWSGLVDKVVIPLVASPIVGFIIAFILMWTLFATLGKSRPGPVRQSFQRLQLLSSAFMAFNHGQNDAQKSMGIITMALVSYHVIAKPDVPDWTKLICAIAMALGTSAGGWRIMRTMGHRIIRLEPIHGFAAETAAGITILLASLKGMPVSTTHVISGSIFGVGASRRLSAVRWGVAQSMVIAWILTIPAAALMAALCYGLLAGIAHLA